MKTTTARTLAALLVFVWMGLLLPDVPTGHAQGNAEMTPDNTVILSNETDAAFCRDIFPSKPRKDRWSDRPPRGRGFLCWGNHAWPRRKHDGPT